MPELPEVETVRLGVDAAFVGRRIRQVSATGARTLRRGGGAAALVSRTQGARLIATDRLGKYLMLRLDNDETVVIHLGMSGQLLKVPRPAIPAAHTHVVFDFDRGDALHFVDPRTFGEVFVTTAAPGERPQELAHLGIDALDPSLSVQLLKRLFATTPTPIKAQLLSQRLVAGVGNIYADEILWDCRIRYDRPTNAIAPVTVGRLHASMRRILAASVQAGGSSLSDGQYLDLEGAAGTFAESHAAYGREGLPCPRCGRRIVKVVAAGRGTHYCPRCQH